MQAESSSPVIMKHQIWSDPLFEYFQRFLKSTLTYIFTLWVKLSWLGHTEHQKNWRDTFKFAGLASAVTKRLS